MKTTMKTRVPRTCAMVVIYVCLGLFLNTALAFSDTSETKQDSNDETISLQKRDVDNYGLYSDLDKRQDEQVTELDGELGQESDEFDFDGELYKELENEKSELENDGSTMDAYGDDSDKEKRYRYYGFESQLGKRGGPMGFMSQLGKRNFGYFSQPSPDDFIEQRGLRGPMGFFSQLGKRGGPMGFYTQLGKRSPMGFMSQLGKRAPMAFMSQLGKRTPMGFYAQLGKRSPMGFMSQLGKRGGPMGFFSQLGKRAPMGFYAQLGKRYPMGFISQLGKRRTPSAFFSQLGKRSPMGFLSQLGKRGRPMGFMSQLGKRSEFEDMEIASNNSSESLARRKRSTRAIPWESIRQRLALNKYFHPYNRFGFRGRMGKRYPGYSFFSQLG